MMKEQLPAPTFRDALDSCKKLGLLARRVQQEPFRPRPKDLSLLAAGPADMPVREGPVPKIEHCSRNRSE